jgi:hypothetical protein
MTIFPSENEKLITTAILAACIGGAIGMFSALKLNDSDSLIASMATLAAAFFGAFFAYSLENRARQRREQEQYLAQSNDLLIALFQKINALTIFQWDFVEPCRDDPGKMISMLPALDFKLPDPPLRPESVNFLVKSKHKQLLFDIHIEDQRFAEAMKTIRYRSHLHLNYVHPALHSAGLVEGVEYTETEFKAALGELMYARLKQATEAVVYHVDRTVKSSDQLRKKLIKALKETFPKQEILEFTLKEIPPSKAPQPTPKSGAAGL